MTLLSIMAALKLYVVLLSAVATTLACDLTPTDEETELKLLAETYINVTKPDINPRYRQLYHVAPPVGWMNDPNGFSFFKDNYHLFYQFYPYDTSTGYIHWGHVISKDLVKWTQLPVALAPQTEQIFSGSAIEKDGTLVLIYTAHKGVEPDTNETQYLAFSNDGVIFTKYKNNPVISFSPNSSKDFRDPKIWKHGNYWYVVLGSKNGEGTTGMGEVLVYRSADMGYWEFLNVVASSNGNLGYMWECPDFFELNGNYVLLMSPQGMNASGDRYQNQFQTGYIIGSFDYETGKFVEKYAFQEIDYGHDFYATQTMERNNKRYLIAWMGSWDGAFPEREDGWAGSMTIIRELTLSGSRILMKPIDAITELRESAVYNGSLAQTEYITGLTKTGELLVSFDLTQDISLAIRGVNDVTNDTKVIELRWDATVNKVILDRQGVIRQGEWVPVSSKSLRIFLDGSSIEVFCGEGEVVFSSRAYPDGNWHITNLGAQSVNVVAYPLSRSVPE